MIDYIQNGLLLPKAHTRGAQLVDGLALSFARALDHSTHWLATLPLHMPHQLSKHLSLANSQLIVLGYGWFNMS
jgi:hypothetical protein